MEVRETVSGPVTDMKILVGGGGVLEGTVLSSDGKPAAGLDVYLLHPRVPIPPKRSGGTWYVGGEAAPGLFRPVFLLRRSPLREGQISEHDISEFLLNFERLFGGFDSIVLNFHIRRGGCYVGRIEEVRYYDSEHGPCKQGRHERVAGVPIIFTS